MQVEHALILTPKELRKILKCNGLKKDFVDQHTICLDIAALYNNKFKEKNYICFLVKRTATRGLAQNDRGTQKLKNLLVKHMEESTQIDFMLSKVTENLYPEKRGRPFKLREYLLPMTTLLKKLKSY